MPVSMSAPSARVDKSGHTPTVAVAERHRFDLVDADSGRARHKLLSRNTDHLSALVPYSASSRRARVVVCSTLYFVVPPFLSSTGQDVRIPRTCTPRTASGRLGEAYRSGRGARQSKSSVRSRGDHSPHLGREGRALRVRLFVRRVAGEPLLRRPTAPPRRAGLGSTVTGFCSGRGTPPWPSTRSWRTSGSSLRSCLDSYTRLGSAFGDHPDMRRVPGCDFSSGSLGHALSAAVGMALGARIQGHDFRVFTLLGDGELHEGQIWEAAMAAGHYRLHRLVAIVDRNELPRWSRRGDHFARAADGALGGIRLVGGRSGRSQRGRAADGPQAGCGR